MKIDNSPARGNRDLLPGAVSVRDRVLGEIADVYRRFGYQRIETPALEDIKRLQSGEGGDNEKLIFRVLRRGLPDRVEPDTSWADVVDLGLRYDLTVPLTRFFGNNQAVLPNPFRSFQFGPVWRAERPQKGRYRQFYQCDIDLIGEPTVLAEAELIEATTEALARIGLSGATVRLSDRRFLTALAAFAGVPEEATASFFITLDKLDKIGWSGVRSELLNRGLDKTVVDTVVEVVGELGGLSSDKLVEHLSTVLPNLSAAVLSDLDTTAQCLRRLAAEREVGEESAVRKESTLHWEFDPTLVRGMGYYTGQIFEVGHLDMPGSLAGGGRYDQLIGRTLGKDVPACGFSIGFERIVELLQQPLGSSGVAVLVEAEVDTTRALEFARGLRAEGRTVTIMRRQGKFGAQLGRLAGWGYTSYVHLRSDSDGEPEELLLDSRSSKK